MNSIYKLSDICDVRDGTHDSPKYVRQGYPLVTSKNIIDGKLDLSTVNYVSEDDYNKINERSKVDIGDIIMPMIGTIGNPLLVGEYCSFAIKNVALVKFPNSFINNKYVWYYLKSSAFKKYVASKNRGGTQKFLSLGDIRNIHIPALTINEQIDAVEKLDKVAKVLDFRKQELEKLNELIKARFVEMFGKGKYPLVAISDLVEKKVSTAKRDFNQDDIIKYIDISSIDNKRNLMTGYTEYILSEAPSRAQQHVIKGDILISTVRPNLRNVAIISYEDDNLIASSGFCVLRAKKCLPSYLMAIACSNEFTDAMSKVVTGANYPAIKDSDVMGYAVSLPPIELQRAFEMFTEQVNKSKVAVQKALDEAQLLFDSLMQKYFG